LNSDFLTIRGIAADPQTNSLLYKLGRVLLASLEPDEQNHQPTGNRNSQNEYHRQQ